MGIELVKKFKVGLFIYDDVNKGYVRIEKSTAFDLALNPTVNTRDYIVDQHPTNEVDGYAPTLNQAITMYKGNPDYEVLFPLAYNMATGDKAKKDVLVVFMNEPLTIEGEEGESIQGFKAWKTNATLSFTNINTVESTLTVDINFGGTIEKGYATPDEAKQPVFVKTENEDDDFVDPFKA